MNHQWCYTAIAAMLGVAVAYFSSLLVIFSVLVYIGYCFWRLSKLPFLICVLSSCFFFCYTSYIEQNNQPVPNLGKQNIVASVTATPVIDGDRLSFPAMTVRGERLRMLYTIPTLGEKEALQKLQAGVSCTFAGERTEPSPARNFGAFDYKDYLYKQNIHHLYKISSLSSCKKSPTLWQWLFAIRQQAVSHVQEQFSTETASFMNALIYGDRQAMDAETEDRYQRLGLVHLLAISGSHITLLVAGCYYILLRLGTTRQVATALLLVIVPLYMYMAGASPSVVRASVTAVALLFCMLWSKRLSGLDALSIAALTMLLFDPYVLFDIGFQFSFSATLVLVLSATTILSPQKGLLRNMWNVAVVAQLASLPILLHHFGQLSPYSILLNLIYVPFLSFIILPLCLCTLFVSFLLPPMSTLLDTLLSVLLSGSNQLLKVEGVLPFGKLVFGLSPSWLTIGYCIVILFIFLVWETGRIQLLIYSSGILFFSLVLHLTLPSFSSKGQVTFVDVGQGDCIFIELPYRQGTYMIDTGGAFSFPKQEWQKRKRPFSVGSDIVVPYVESRGVRHIDKLILTHGDQDHVGAALEVIAAVSVGEIVLGQKETFSELEEQIITVAQEKGIPISLVKSGASWKTESASFQVLSPFGDEKGSNDQSIVLRAEIGGLSWLFTGDLEEEGEEGLLREGELLKADVLKVGHHGSNTSTSQSFLQRIQPRFAIISAGQNNRYGHPHQEVTERLIAEGVHILRTDQGGAITYSFSKKRGTFHTKLTYDENTIGEGEKNKTAGSSLMSQYNELQLR